MKKFYLTPNVDVNDFKLEIICESPETKSVSIGPATEENKQIKDSDDGLISSSKDRGYSLW